MDTRVVCEQDLELVCRHREEMFRDAGTSEDVLSAMKPHFRDWLAPRLADGRYFGFLALHEGRPVGGIGLILIDWPPHPFHPTRDNRGYVLNLFVENACRKRGVATALMRLAEAEFANRGITYSVLHATEKGMPLYAELGWTKTSEMAKGLKNNRDSQPASFVPT